MDDTVIKFHGRPFRKSALSVLYTGLLYKRKNSWKSLLIGDFFNVRITAAKQDEEGVDVEAACSKDGPSELVDDQCSTTSRGSSIVEMEQVDALAQLQLVWHSSNSTISSLACLKLYYPPEQIEMGRTVVHGEHEVLCEEEKVVCRLETLYRWIEEAQTEICSPLILQVENQQIGCLNKSSKLDQSSVIEALSDTNVIGDGLKLYVIRNPVILSHEVDEKEVSSGALGGLKILSYSAYCRLRALLKLASFATSCTAVFQALVGGVTRTSPDWAHAPIRLLFARDLHQHSILHNHPDLLCIDVPCFSENGNRHKMKCREFSDDSVSSSEKSDTYSVSSTPPAQQLATSSDCVAEKSDRQKRRIMRPNKDFVSMEEKSFLRGLHMFMAKQKQNISKIPSLGFKQLDLYQFYAQCCNMGGYEEVCRRKLWKHIYDKLGGNPGSTSAATCTRKHYERLLLPYEKHLKSLTRSPIKRSNQERRWTKPVSCSSTSPIPNLAMRSSLSSTMRSSLSSTMRSSQSSTMRSSQSSTMRSSLSSTMRSSLSSTMRSSLSSTMRSSLSLTMRSSSCSTMHSSGSSTGLPLQSPTMHSTVCPLPSTTMHDSMNSIVHPLPSLTINASMSPTVRPLPNSTMLDSMSSAVHHSPNSTMLDSMSSTVRPLPNSTMLVSMSSTVRPLPNSTMLVSMSSAVRPLPNSMMLDSMSSTVRPLLNSTMLDSMSSTVHPSPSSTMHASMSSTVRPLQSSTMHASMNSTVRPSPSSTMHASMNSTVRPLQSSTMHASMSSTVHPSLTSKICPLPSSTIHPSLNSAIHPSLNSAISPSSILAICPLPSSAVCPLPSSAIRPQPSSAICPQPSSAICPQPSSAICPLPSSTTCPLPSSTTCPLPSSTTCPLPSSTTCPLPSSTTCPLPSSTPRIIPGLSQSENCSSLKNSCRQNICTKEPPVPRNLTPVLKVPNLNSSLACNIPSNPFLSQLKKSCPTEFANQHPGTSIRRQQCNSQTDNLIRTVHGQNSMSKLPAQNLNSSHNATPAAVVSDQVMEIVSNSLNKSSASAITKGHTLQSIVALMNPALREAMQNPEFSANFVTNLLHQSRMLVAQTQNNVKGSALLMSASSSLPTCTSHITDSSNVLTNGHDKTVVTKLSSDLKCPLELSSPNFITTNNCAKVKQNVPKNSNSIHILPQIVQLPRPLIHSCDANNSSNLDNGSQLRQNMAKYDHNGLQVRPQVHINNVPISLSLSSDVGLSKISQGMHNQSIDIQRSQASAIFISEGTPVFQRPGNMKTTNAANNLSTFGKRSFPFETGLPNPCQMISPTDNSFESNYSFNNQDEPTDLSIKRSCIYDQPMNLSLKSSSTSE